MTLVTTHVAVEALLVWLLMGKKNRTLYKKHLWLFTGLTLFAAFPDLDAFIYIHRTYLHTVVWPLLIICGTLVYFVIIKVIRKRSLTDRADLITRSIIIACLFLILHSFLDLNPGPVLLFYPFDTRLYSWHASIIWDLDSVFFIKAFKFSWSSVSLNEGLNAYPLFNLSPTQRIQYFGTQFLELFIAEFPLHLILGLSWLVLFLGRSIYAQLATKPRAAAFFKKLARAKHPLLALGFLTLIFGLILGPAFGLTRVETRSTSTTITFSEKTIAYGFAQNVELDAKDRLNTSGLFLGNSSSCEVVLLIATKPQFQNYTSTVGAFFALYFNNTYSYSWVVAKYRNLTRDFLERALLYQPAYYNRTSSLSYTLETTAALTSALLLVDWNASSAFEVTVQLVNTLSIHRPAAFAFGIVFSSVGILLISATIPLLRRKTPPTIEVETPKNS